MIFYLNFISLNHYRTSIYLFKVNNGNARVMWEFSSKLTITTPGRRQRYHSSVSIVNFEHISLIVLVFPLLTLNT